MVDSRSDAAPPDLFGRIVPPLVVPLVLWLFLWSAASFPLDRQELVRVLAFWAVMYLPVKGLRMLLHRETGVLRNRKGLENLLASVGLIGWVVFSGFVAWVAVAEFGLFGLLPAALASVFYLAVFYNFARAAILGEDW